MILGGTYDLLFGCWHQDTSRPFTPRPDPKKLVKIPEAADATGTYVVCTKCGKEFAYDLKRMKILTKREAKRVILEREAQAKKRVDPHIGVIHEPRMDTSLRTPARSGVLEDDRDPKKEGYPDLREVSDKVITIH